MDNESAVIQITSFVAILFGLFMPNIDSIHGTYSDPEIRRRLHVGEMSTLAITSITGFYAGYRSGNYRPLVMAVTVGVLIIAFYEYVYRVNPVGEPE